MRKSYSTNGNPICPFSKRDCNIQDMDGYTDCTNCSEYGNGASSTGEKLKHGKH